MSTDLRGPTAVLITTFFVLSGCGLEGDLYLPVEQPETESVTGESSQESEADPDTPDKVEEEVKD